MVSLYVALDESPAHLGPFLYISFALDILETHILATVTLMVICVISVFSHLMAFDSALPGMSAMKSSSF